MEFIKTKFDKFGKEPNLYYEGNEKSTSWIGFIFTIIYYFLYLSFFLYKFIRFINKVDISVYDTFPYIEEPPSIKINNNNFYVGFGLEDPETYNPTIDKTIYEAKAFFKEGKREGGEWKWNTKNVELIQCKLEYFGESFREKFKNNSLDNLYCLKDANETLYGHFSYDTYSLFFIQLFPCKNTTENNNHCKPKEIIDKYLNGTYFCMEFEDIELTPQNYTHPARPRNQDIYFSVSKKIFQEIHIFFQIVNVETDKGLFGLILEEINMKKDTYLKYHSSYYMNNYIEDDIYESEKPFANITIKLNDQIRIQRRTYPKIIAIFGDVGGFMDLILIILKIISLFPINILYEKEIVNKLFKFDLRKDYIKVYSKKLKNSKLPIDFQVLNENDMYINSLFHVDESQKKKYSPMDFQNKTKRIEEKIKKNKIFYSYDDSNLKPINKTVDVEKISEFKIGNINGNDIDIDDDESVRTEFSNIDKEEINNKIKNENEKDILDDKKKNFYLGHNSSKSNDNLVDSKESVVEKITMSPIKIYLCCFFSRKIKNQNNLLMDKGIEIFKDKMNIFTIFKKSIFNEIILKKEPLVELLDIPFEKILIN